MSGEKLEWWEPLSDNLYRVGTADGAVWVIRQIGGTLEATKKRGES